MMRKYSVSTIIVAFLALILVGACKNESRPAAVMAPADPSDTSLTEGQIVYVESDTVLARYEAFAGKLSSLEQRLAQAEQSHQQRVRSLEREIQQVQQRMQQGLLAPNQISGEQERIARKEQEILQQRDRVVRELQQAQLALNEELQDNVKRVLEELQKEKGYAYILSYGPGTGVLMADSTLDITEEVLARLNAITPDTTAVNQEQ